MDSVNSDALAPGVHAAQECAAIAADLDRLRGLIGEAGGELATAFGVVAAPAAKPEERSAALAQAVGALQFEDIALQLIAHAQRRLALLEGCLQGLSPDLEPVGHEAVRARLLHHPVGQTGMAAGEVELF